MHDGVMTAMIGAPEGYTNIQALLDDLQAQDPVVKVGEDYVLVGQVCIMLRGLGHILKQPRTKTVVAARQATA